MGEHDTGRNAVIGGLVGILTTFIPFSMVIGGATAGYLQGGTSSDGIRVGAFAGVIQTLSVFFFGGLAVLFFGLLIAGSGEWAIFGFGAVYFIGLTLLTAVFTVGLSALGGWVGNYIKYETDVFS